MASDREKFEAVERLSNTLFVKGWLFWLIVVLVVIYMVYP